MAFWDNTLLTGIDEIDKQHIELCEIASDLFSSFAEGEINEKIEPALIYFEKYVREHFDLEEKFQLKINYPDYQLHKQEHDKFRQQIQKFRLVVENTGVTENLAEKFSLKIVDWLIFHFRETDGQIVKFIDANDICKTNYINEHGMI
jgi:hemerythrin